MGISRRSLLLVGAYGLVLLLTGLGSSRVLTRHEVLAAQPAREMLHAGAWIIPTFAGERRLVKPPTTSWTIAAFMSLLGSEDEFVVRLPAALAGVATALALSMMTALWFGDRIGVIAGLAQLTTYYVQMQARLAEADMLMAACVTGALACFARACVPEVKSSKGLPIAFYLLSGLAFLYKGGVIFVGLAVVCYLLWRRDKQVIRFLWSPIGIGLLLVLLLAWPVAAAIEYAPIVPVWSQEVLGRATGNMGRRDPWHFYFWTVPWIILPWTPFTVVGVIQMARRDLFRQPSGRLLTCWFAPGLVLLSVMAWKHKHYIIPVLPALTVPTALGLAASAAYFAGQSKLKSVTLACLLAVLCAIGIIATMKWVQLGSTQIAVTIGVLLAGGLAVLYQAQKRSVNGQLVAVFATAGTVALSVNLLVVPHYDGYRASAAIARQANTLAAAGETIYLLGLGEAQAVYYLRFPMKRIDDGSLPSKAQGSIALAPQSMVDRLSQSGHVEVLGRSPRGGRSEGDRDALVLLRWYCDGA